MTAEPRDATAWRTHRAELLTFVRKRVRDEASAEDIVHDVLAKAYARRDTLREPSRLRAWLYQITRHAIVDAYRAHRPQEELPPDLAAAPAEDDERRAERELAPCLLPLAEALPSPYAEALLLVDFQGVRQRDLAERLGLSLSGAKSRIQRARRMLKDRLLECCRVELDRRGGVIDYEPVERCRDCE